MVTRGTPTNTPSSVGAWALKRKMSPGALTKGGVGIRRTKRIAPAYFQGCSAALGSVGSILSKAKSTTDHRSPQTYKQTNKQSCASVWVAWCACLLVLGRCCGCAVLSPCLPLEEEPGLLPEVRADSAVSPPAALFLLLPFASLLDCVPRPSRAKAPAVWKQKNGEVPATCAKSARAGAVREGNRHGWQPTLLWEAR